MAYKAFISDRLALRFVPTSVSYQPLSILAVALRSIFWNRTLQALRRKVEEHSRVMLTFAAC